MSRPSLLKKIYPPTVRMRPVLLKIGVGVVLALVLCLIGVLVTSLRHQRHAAQHKETSVALLANHSDVMWYQNEESQSAKNSQMSSSVSDPLPQGALSQSHPATFVSSTRESIATVPVTPSSQPMTTKPRDAQPSTAPMISNQLLGEQFYKNGLAHSNSLNEESNQTGQDTKERQDSNDYLAATVKKPVSPYELQAGAIIPALLITGINSELPGTITAQVKTPVYDSVSGRFILIPQGSRLIGVYDAKIMDGQERVLVVWQRLIFPNGHSIDLAGMPGVDLSGYSGFHDQVHHHYGRLFGSVILMSLLSSGAQLSQPQVSSDTNQSPSINQMLAQSLGTNIADTSTMLLRKNLNIPPTLQIRPGYELNVMVTKDMVFPSPYGDH